MKAIDQFVAGYANGDAISNEAVVLRGIFRSWGYESEIFCETKRILPELRKDARDLSQYTALRGSDDLLLLHLSIGSPANDLFQQAACRKALLYHNVTPAHYFSSINRGIAHELEKGQEQVRRLAGVAGVTLADSAFNAAELTAAGYRDVKVLPLVLNFDALRAEPDGRILRRFNDDRVNILFVGRCVPNKKLDELITAFFHFQRYVEPRSRLFHVGSFAGTERYHYLLRARVRELGLDEVHLTGSVPQAQLNAYYECADVFLCMSEHEGFCIPIIESMVHDVPVVAYAAAAVPETMDGAGILFHEKRFDLLAELLGRLTHDDTLRNAVLNGQRERVVRLAKRDLAAELKQHLGPVMA